MPSATPTRRSPDDRPPGAPSSRLRTRDAPPFRRSASNVVLGGVAAGLGERWGVDPALVRSAFVVLSLGAGAGAVVYAVAWAVSADPDPYAKVRAPTAKQGAAFGLLVLGATFGLRAAGLWFGDTVGVPVLLGAVGWALLAARSDDRLSPGMSVLADQRGRTDAKPGLVRAVAGGVLVVAGVGAFLAARSTLADIGTVVLAAGVTAAGLAVVFGPLARNLVAQVSAERRDRIRSEERAEMAAHLHDSVLQTLALIQRNASSPGRVVSLARGQERELRAWLYGDGAGQDGESLRTVITKACEAVEQAHDVVVDVVIVGDRPMDDRLRSLVGALSEAATNAARHAGAGEVSVYVEAEPTGVKAYIRDRGKGFDESHVPADRGGIAGSIRGRLERAGGRAIITSTPGDGTEVELWLPGGTS